MNTGIVNLLMIEDDPAYVFLVMEFMEEINNSDYFNTKFSLDYVNTLEKGIVRYHEGDFDVILLDLGLPDGHGISLVNQIRDKGILRPIIIFTAYSDIKYAFEAIAKGVQDYMVKGDVNTGIFYRAICFAQERQKMLNELKDIKSQISALGGLLPICNRCKGIRNDDGYWKRIEEYIATATDIKISHGFCPDCLESEMKKLNEKLDI